MWPSSFSNSGFFLVLVLLLANSGLATAEKRCKYTGVDQGVHKDIEAIADVEFASDCCNKCLADPKCVAFTHIGSDSKCYTKYDTQPVDSSPNAGASGNGNPLRLVSGTIEEVPDSVVRTAIEAQSRKSCEKYTGRQLDVYHDMRMYDEVEHFDACCELCKEDIDCKAINWDTDNRCWLKFNDGPIVPDEAANVPGLRTDTGIIKIGPAPPPVKKPGHFHMKYKELSRDSL